VTCCGSKGGGDGGHCPDVGQLTRGLKGGRGAATALQQLNGEVAERGKARIGYGVTVAYSLDDIGVEAEACSVARVHGYAVATAMFSAYRQHHDGLFFARQGTMLQELLTERHVPFEQSRRGGQDGEASP